jgi:hypothetical protein
MGLIRRLAESRESTLKWLTEPRESRPVTMWVCASGGHHLSERGAARCTRVHRGEPELEDDGDDS